PGMARKCIPRTRSRKPARSGLESLRSQMAEASILQRRSQEAFLGPFLTRLNAIHAELKSLTGSSTANPQIGLQVPLSQICQNFLFHNPWERVLKISRTISRGVVRCVGFARDINGY